jgi:hypothetical protein
MWITFILPSKNSLNKGQNLFFGWWITWWISGGQLVETFFLNAKRGS